MEYKLKDNFVNKYKKIEPPFGFNGLGKLVYLRTYSRLKKDGSNEKWFETIRRVVEGTYSIQKGHIIKYGLGWDENKAHRSAEEMYDKMFYMKFLPAGRGLWAMGTSLIHEKGLFIALNSCAFVSTKNIKTELSKPFEFMMDFSMLGTGIGFDLKGADKITILSPSNERSIFEIPDTREGWIEALRRALRAFLEHSTSLPEFKYNKIRKRGTLIKGFGGKSAGPEPLIKLLNQIIKKLTKRIGQKLSGEDITDIMNMIGVCVVAGNVRRTAQIVFGEDTEEYLKLKDYHWDDKTQTYKGSKIHRAEYGWASNNSIFAQLGQDYTKVAEQTALNGEPGYIWLDNIQDYSRLKDTKDYKDLKALGTNPCFTYNTPILTPKGYEEIGSLSDFKYYTFIDRYGNETTGHVSKTGLRDVISLNYRLNGQNKELKCTSNHLFLTTTGEAIRAKNLKGRRIQPYYKHRIFDEKDYLYISLGFVQGDGRTNPAPRQKTVTAWFGKKDDDMKEIFSTLDYSLLEELNFSKEKLPNRDLPKDIILWKDKYILNFLTGLYTANGSVLKTAKRVTLKTSNYKLAKNVKILLSTFDINSYITTNKQKSVKFKNGIYTCKQSYDLNIIQFDSLKLFAEHISFVQKYKRDLLDYIIINRSPSIQYIKEIGKEEVYDFTLYNTDNWGVIQDGLIAHNCGEQSLESYEMCNLVETFITNHDDIDDFKRTLKFAYLYAKTVTLGKTHWVETNRVQLRNRRIGTSMSGIAQFIDSRGLEELRNWSKEGFNTIQYYDNIYSEWFAIPKSIKFTCVKPSGSISLLAGVTPGMHYPESNYYIRRMRIANNSDLLPYIQEAGYHTELDSNDGINTTVVEIPIAIEGVRTINDVSMWEQLSLASFLQKHWADNQVSCTVTFKKHERDQIASALNYFQYQLKGVSFLPKLEKASYPQMPYEEITKDEYKKKLKKIKNLMFNGIKEDATPEMYCNNDTCEII